MTPTRAIFESMLALLGADTASMSKTTGSANTLRLINQPFVPPEGGSIGDLGEADFDGYAPLDVLDGAQPQSNDPANGDSVLRIQAAVGLFQWETTGVNNLPQTIYGYALCNAGGTTVYGTKELATPIVLTAANQFVAVNDPDFRQVVGSVL